MKTLTKAVVGSLMAAGAAVATAAPASAGVGVNLNLGLFAPAPPPPPAVPAYCYGAYYYANCGFQVYDQPVFWNGYWYNNARFRMVRGHREFWVNGGWHEARERDHDDRDRGRDRDHRDNDHDRGDRDRR